MIWHPKSEAPVATGGPNPAQHPSSRAPREASRLESDFEELRSTEPYQRHDDSPIDELRRTNKYGESPDDDEDDPTLARSSQQVAAPTSVEPSPSMSIRAALSAGVDPSTLMDGRYQLLNSIGVGGMGEVWAGRHVALGRPVAIKFLTQEEGGPRFLREAQAINAIDHDGVVDVLDFGETPQGVPYFVMELLRGQTLEALIRAHGPMPWPHARRIALEITDALASVHDAGVVHRDLKPSNVFVLEPTPASGSSVKLIDFGIAKVIGDHRPKLTRTGFVHGTPAYMSPEQALGEPVDGRTDVYGLGCLLYYVLLGCKPFPNFKGAEALRAQLYEMPQPFAVVRPDHELSEELESIVFRALAKERSARFESMRAMHEALARVPATARRGAPSMPPYASQVASASATFGHGYVDSPLTTSDSQGSLPGLSTTMSDSFSSSSQIQAQSALGLSATQGRKRSATSPGTVITALIAAVVLLVAAVAIMVWQLVL